MVIRRKSSIYKKLYEINGQQMMFGHDNLDFKTINLPSKQRYKSLCSKFGLKKFKSSGKKNFQIININ
tara:strand:- start:156 stop:359 length:204 start_codon:yes stop_codon:yes gene_type:complete